MAPFGTMAPTGLVVALLAASGSLKRPPSKPLFRSNRPLVLGFTMPGQVIRLG